MKICVYGSLRSGKSEVCKIIAEELNCEVFDFGDALKECVKIAYPETINQSKNRTLLIKFGQHLRKLDEDIWVNVVKHKIENSSAKNILVTGTRQKNEYEMLKDKEFIFIRVYADEGIRLSRCLINGDKFNPEDLESNTETELRDFNWDYLIMNNGTIEDLRVKVLSILKNLNKEK